jgi:hypothetical protein
LHYSGSFSGAERAEIRAVVAWHKSCVVGGKVKPGCVDNPVPTTTTTKPPVTTTVPPTTTTTVPPVTNVMPTRGNTGPSGINGTMTAAQFLSSRVCDHKTIVDQVRDESSFMAGKTFTINNCNLSQGLYYANYSAGGEVPNTPLPTVNINNSSISGWYMFSPMVVNADKTFVSAAYWVPCPNCGGDDHQPNQHQANMPVTITNSYFWVPAPPAPETGYGYHSEGLHVVSSGSGYSFTNVRFTQEGPMNGNITGAIKFSGRNSIFKDVYFDFGGTAPASYFTVYFEGINLQITNCKIERGVANYKFPDVWSAGNGYVVPVLQNCKDFNTGANLGNI